MKTHDERSGIPGVQEEKKKGNKAEATLEEIMAKIFPKLICDISIVRRIRIDKNKSCLGAHQNITVKLLETS